MSTAVKNDTSAKKGNFGVFVFFDLLKQVGAEFSDLSSVFFNENQIDKEYYSNLSSLQDKQ